MLYRARVECSNKSEWLVLLHGFCGNSEMWWKQIDFFKHYYNLLLIDLPGHGRSTEGIYGKNIESFSDLSASIVEVLKEEKIDKAHFLGVSLGTMVIGGILKRNPEVVDKVILCDAVVVSNRMSICTVKLVEKVQKYVPYRLILYIGNFILLPFPVHRIVGKFYNKSGCILGQKEFNTWYSLIIKELDILKDIEYNKNVLFISGIEDLHFITGVKELCEVKGEIKLETIKNSGHVCCMQKKEEFNSKVLKFLRTKKLEGI